MTVNQAVLGCGRWGSFHMWYGCLAGNRVTGWEPPGNPQFRQLRRTGRNEYLKLPDGVRLTEDLDDVTLVHCACYLSVEDVIFSHICERYLRFSLRTKSS